MIIGDRLRELLEQKKLTQGDIEKRTGLLRCYVSRVENGHTAPAIETLEKMARALEVPLYQLFYDAEESPQLPNLLKRKSLTKALGAVRARMRGSLASFAVCWVGQMRITESYCCKWHKRWPVGSSGLCFANSFSYR